MTANQPTYRVEAASVSLLKGGDYLLLLRTDAGLGRFFVPAAVGRGVFHVTNPVCLATPKDKQGPVLKPGGRIL